MLIPIIIQHPAQINMSAYKQLAIGNFSGRSGDYFSTELKERLVNGGIFSVTDRSQLDQIFAQLRLSQSDLADPRSRLKIGKLLNSAAIITGRDLDVSYDVQVTYNNMTCQRPVGKKEVQSYACTQYTKVCSAGSLGSLDVVDVQTGRILISRKLRNSCSDRASAIDGEPQCQRDQGALQWCALSWELAEFVRTISPWQERRFVPFMKDSSLPTLETGIRNAQVGDLGEAIKIFSAAAKSAETNPKIKSAAIAKAYWNLGLALEYTEKYNQALLAFKKAYLLNPVHAYLAEQANVKQLRRNAEELKRQGLAK